MKKIILCFALFLSLLILTSCWNYREADNLAIVAGVAIDCGTKERYLITVEIIEMASGKDGKMSSKIISVEGETMFDAARNMISISGKRLYWSHAKIIVLSQEIAKEDVLEALTWYIRDAETRESVHILLSQQSTAKEILIGDESKASIKSFEIDEAIKNQQSLSKAPKKDILSYTNEYRTKGISSILPTVKLVQADGNRIPQLIGTAIIKENQLVGFLNGDETQDLLIIRNELKGGILPERIDINNEIISVSLEIIKHKTKIKPIFINDQIQININTETLVSLAEIQGQLDFNDEEVLKKIENTAAKALEERIKHLIKKVQLKYSADIFGFGTKIREENNEKWKLLEEQWEDIFGYLDINVNSKITIKSAGILSKPIETKE